ncbi:signal peptide peptidase SppA [Aestuariivirga sp.]|uniref:signal peptide peptidase SppA n=1 Tax=Aestuariivirga sp. TaxID=2650926 RepID=UPI0039E2EAF0
MAITDAELIVDRRRMKRRLMFWRIAAVLIALAGLIAWFGQMDFDRYRDHIARIRIDGTITGDQPTLDLLSQLENAKAVKAVIIHIDSPGGTTAGSEAIYEEIRDIAKVKPVVAVMDTVAASGGYITAIAADHIVARGNTITGSIGVIFAFPEISKLLDTLGIKMEEVKSAELKAEPTPYKPMSDKVRAVTNEMIQDSFAWFKGLVAERRKIDPAQVDILADGRVYTGRQAVANHLVDELGGEEKAIDWLKTEKKIADGTPVLDWSAKSNSESSGLGFSIANGVIRALGFEGFRERAESARLDGLLVLWHPDL